MIGRIADFGIREDVAIVNFCKTLSEGPEARRIRGQLADSGTSVASNYRGACRARSRAEFISRSPFVRKKSTNLICG
jgi:four helix bundle protein